MCVDEALSAARAGRIALLIDADHTAEELATRLGSDGRVLQPDELTLGGPFTAGATIVVAGAEGLAGLIEGCWAGPWTLRDWHERTGPEATLLHARELAPTLATALAERLDIPCFGEGTATEPDSVGSTESIAGSRIEEALARAEEGTLLASPDEATLLRDLAYCGVLPAVWRVPFLVRVANDRRFKHPFVDEDPDLAAFHDVFMSHVAGLGMLESAEFRLRGRHDKDLRRFAAALDIPVLRLAQIFRRLDRTRLVISTAVEEGAGQRPNLVVQGTASPPDVDAAARAVSELRGIRATLALATDEPAAERGTRTEEVSPMAALFSSLDHLAPAPPDIEEAEPVPEPSPVPAAPPVTEPREPLPDHLPGLPALAEGDLASARAALGEVEGEGEDEAVLLGSFVYEVLDADGGAVRRFAIPDSVVAVARRALELERSPMDRVRETLDAEFPDAFVEVPRPGLIEVFFDGGELAGSHRLRELPGRRAFEAPRLRGARAVQRELAAGRATAGDPGDAGWLALAEVLSQRDAGEGLAAWETLERVDVDVDVDPVRQGLIELLPPEHEERVALEERRERERRERELREARAGVGLALRARGQDDGPGFLAIEGAEAAGQLDELAAFLEQREERNPRDPGPALWLGRLLLRRDDLREAEAAYFRAVYAVAGGARGVEWWFELVDHARKADQIGWMWGAYKRFLREEPDPRAVDRQLARRLDDGEYGEELHGDLRKILDRFGGRRAFPQAWRHLQTEQDVDSWKAALLGIKIDD